jgi:cytochrome c oxidase subunit 2
MRDGSGAALHRQRGPAALVPALASALALGGCRGVQSALDPAADDAGRIAVLSQILFWGGLAIFLLVAALLAVAILGPPERRRWLAGRSAVVGLGVAFPVVVLTAVFVYGLLVLRATNAARGPGSVRIEVVGEQYWWRVRYLGPDGAEAFVTANEIQVPVGRPVELLLSSADVIHALWIPNFGGKVDMIPGRVNRLTFRAERAGVYRGQCTEFCGDQHARMAFDVVALEPAAFEDWARRQAGPAPEPATPELGRGRTLYRENGCGSCHAVRGVSDGRLGPDLTRVGARRTIGAGMFPTNVGSLAGWVAGTQALKPGARMPSYGALSGPDLRALAAYLASLR